ncbi:protein AIG1 [Biomphalaria glabrata]|nr:protein AIG1 [Biomphalaria glabrata]
MEGNNRKYYVSKIVERFQQLERNETRQSMPSRTFPQPAKRSVTKVVFTQPNPTSSTPLNLETDTKSTKTVASLIPNDGDVPLKMIRKQEGRKFTTASPSDQIDLLMIGKTGYGKSALGNSILNCDAFVSEPSSTSVTKEVCDKVNEVNGRTIKVVDSPGVGDTDWEKDETTHFVTNALSQAIVINPQGYHAFLLVVKFGGRFTKEDKGTVDYLKKVFGLNFVSKFCILVLTYGDQFEAQVKISFQDWIQSQKGVLSDLVKECNNRVILFDNRTTDRHKKQRQVNELIEIVDSLKLENCRYTNDQFDLAKTEREALMLSTKAPQITDEVLTEANIIFQQFKHALSCMENDPTHLEPLLNRINKLYDSIKRKDNETGVLGDLLIHLETIKTSISDEIKIYRRLLEIEFQKKKEKVNESLALAQRLRETKLINEQLKGEGKQQEKEIQKLKESEAEWEQQRKRIMAELYSKIVKEIPKIEEQNKKINAKHRNFFFSICHKIKKTFTNKTKTRQ